MVLGSMLAECIPYFRRLGSIGVDAGVGAPSILGGTGRDSCAKPFRNLGSRRNRGVIQENFLITLFSVCRRLFLTENVNVPSSQLRNPGYATAGLVYCKFVIHVSDF